MSPRLRLFIAATAVLLPLAACSSGGSDASSSTTAAKRSTTTAPAATTTKPGTTTGGSSTDVSTPAKLPSCQDLLTEYANRFTMDDLTDAARFFREYAPLMPKDVGAASIRIADAYDKAKGDPANLNFADVDLTADAKTFSDWTSKGCPTG